MASGITFVVEKDKLSSLPASVQAALSKLVAETAAKVEGRAKEGAPVDTGYLRNSIAHEANGLTAVVSVGAEYGLDVEMGTVKSAAQPFVTPAVEGERSDFNKAIGAAIAETAN